MSRLSISLLIPTVIGCSVLLASCGASRSSNASVHRTTVVGPGSKTDKRTFEISPSLAPQSHALLSEVKSWIGTPYKYGGEDKSGVDCSGLVLNVYRSALRLKLPRNSAEQADFCQPLAKNALMPGDLIFFNTSGGKKVSHVGIYVGNGQMVHSSSSKGVIVSDINTNYFQKTFAGAGYVEKYREMIASNNRDSHNRPTNTAMPSPKPSDPVTEDGSGFSLSPVSSLPTRKTASNPKETRRDPDKQATTKTAVKVNITENGKAVIEPTPEEARKKVLNSIIEQKLDSIFNQ